MTDWKDRALSATHGTRFGAIIACMLGHSIDAPRFDGKAIITSDAFVMCNFTTAEGERELGAFVGGLDDIETNVAGLADHLNLSAAEREEFAKVLEGWIAMEYCDGKARLRKAATKGLSLH